MSVFVPTKLKSVKRQGRLQRYAAAITLPAGVFALAFWFYEFIRPLLDNTN